MEFSGYFSFSFDTTQYDIWSYQPTCTCLSSLDINVSKIVAQKKTVSL